MTATWISFLPRDVALAISHAPAGPLGQERRYTAVALFADVSGFTAISEALAVAGRRGTEELTSILNSYFSPMIDLIESYGGIIGKFGGDAMTVLFPYTGRTRAAVVRRAIQCALDMQAAMGRYSAIPTSAGIYSLAMKAGLALGTALSTTVGDPEIRLEYIIAGNLLDLCADAEHHATKGEVVIHNALLEYAGQLTLVEERGDFSCIAGLHQRVRHAPLPPPAELPALAVEQFAHYLHPSIAERIRAGLSGFLNEHRRVTVLFVSFSGFDYDGDPQVAQKLQPYLTAVIRTIYNYDGYLNKVDMGDKGSKYIVLFGAPVAHENDEERAVRCALELRDLHGVTARIGVNTGVVYCGQVGSDARQEYTVMGDPVNLAARLMQAAKPGQVLVSDATRRNTPAAIVWESLAPIMVKGKSEPIVVYTAKSLSAAPSLALHEPAYALPMVGREHELQRAEALLKRVAQGRGQILGISAEAGMGKSRLSAAIMRLARSHGFRIYGGACQSYGTQTSYLVWHDVWRGFFGIAPDWEPETSIRHLETHLRGIDARLARMPLLGPALHLPIPDNDLTRALDPQLRTELLKALLLECLRQAAHEQDRSAGPLLIVLEDCHWIDPLSQELLEYIGRNMAELPVLLLALYRPPTAMQAPLQWAVRMPFFSELHLAELGEAEGELLVRQKCTQLWAKQEVPAALVEQIAQRAGGNPFYLEEIVNFIHDRGLDPDDTAALQQLELPDSLQSLILSRIDQLAEAEKTTLKVASVVGRVFKAQWLWGSYPQVGTPQDVRRHLQNLSRIDLTPLDKPEPELEYIFKHITTQEVAYESLAFAMRTVLHECIGSYIERSYGDGIAQYLDILAHHYGRSNNAAKQQLYYRLAGNAARATYANRAAIEYYRRLLELVPETEQAGLLVDLGEIQQLTGNWSDAEANYRLALERAEAAADLHSQARGEVALGALLASTQSFSEALRWIENGQALFEQLHDQSGIGRALERAAQIYFEQGDYERARTCSEQRLAIAQEQSDQAGISAALDQLGNISTLAGNVEAALTYLRQSLEVAAAAGNAPRMIIAGNDLAGAYWSHDDYPQALAQLGPALATAAEIGYLQMVGFILGNAGTVYLLYGDNNNALTCYRQALSITADLGDWPAILPNLGNMAIVLKARGQYALAERIFIQSIMLERTLNIPYCLCDDLYHCAELYERQQRYAEALPLCEEAQQVAVQIERKDIQFQAQVLAVRLRLAYGLHTVVEAITILNALRETIEEANEQAAIEYALWQIEPENRMARDTAAALYRSLYEATPNAEYRARYAALTGDFLPEPPALPDLPAVGRPTADTPEELLERIIDMSSGFSHEENDLLTK